MSDELDLDLDGPSGWGFMADTPEARAYMLEELRLVELDYTDGASKNELQYWELGAMTAYKLVELLLKNTERVPKQDLIKWLDGRMSSHDAIAMHLMEKLDTEGTMKIRNPRMMTVVGVARERPDRLGPQEQPSA